jgi:hypothetical protein
LRVCPKCGFIDSAIWRQSAFHQTISFTEFSSIEFESPELATKLKETGRLSEGNYAYKLTRFGRVERQAIMDNPDWEKHWDIPAEKSKGLKTLPKQWHNPASMYRDKIYGVKNQPKLELFFSENLK